MDTWQIFEMLLQFKPPPSVDTIIISNLYCGAKCKQINLLIWPQLRMCQATKIYTPKTHFDLGKRDSNPTL